METCHAADTQAQTGAHAPAWPLRDSAAEAYWRMMSHQAPSAAFAVGSVHPAIAKALNDNDPLDLQLALNRPHRPKPRLDLDRDEVREVLNMLREHH